MLKVTNTLALAIVLGALAQVGLAQDAQRPSRIISLVPAATEMLFELGVGGRVVGVSSFDRHPPEVETIARVGALLDPDVERILALRPDLAVVYHSQTDLRTQLEAAKVPLFVYTHAGLPDVVTTLRALAGRVGAAARGEALAEDIETGVARVRARVAGLPKPRTLIVFGREAFSLRGIYASGGLGFVHDMVTAAGGENVFGDVKREAVQATSELILARKPDVILELRADPLDPAALAREIRTWSVLPSVPAVRNGRVHILVDPRTVIPGPRIVGAIEALAGVLHGRRNVQR